MNKATLLKLRSVYKYAVFSILVSSSVQLTGCMYDPFYYGPPAHSSYHPHYYDHYYYPSAQVYFHFATGFYYYRDSGSWIKVKVLPPNIFLDARDRVRIKIESDKPYLKYPQHTRIYKPKPNYRADKDRSIKEQEANRLWYREHEKKQEKQKMNPKNNKIRDRF